MILFGRKWQIGSAGAHAGCSMLWQGDTEEHMQNAQLTWRRKAHVFVLTCKLVRCEPSMAYADVSAAATIHWNTTMYCRTEASDSHQNLLMLWSKQFSSFCK